MRMPKVAVCQHESRLTASLVKQLSPHFGATEAELDRTAERLGDIALGAHELIGRVTLYARLGALALSRWASGHTARRRHVVCEAPSMSVFDEPRSLFPFRQDPHRFHSYCRFERIVFV